VKRAGKKQPALDLETAEAVALQGLAFLAEDGARLARFCTATGLDPAELRARAGTGELLAAVLEHLAGDESLLLVFASGRDIAPERIGQASAVLEGARR